MFKKLFLTLTLSLFLWIYGSPLRKKTAFKMQQQCNVFTLKILQRDKQRLYGIFHLTQLYATDEYTSFSLRTVTALFSFILYSSLFLKLDTDDDLFTRCLKKTSLQDEEDVSIIFNFFYIKIGFHIPGFWGLNA